MQVIGGQIRQLEKIVESNPPTSRITLPTTAGSTSGTPSPRQRQLSTSSDLPGEEGPEEENLSPLEHLQNMERDSSPLSDDRKLELKEDMAVEELVKEGSSYECCIS